MGISVPLPPFNRNQIRPSSNQTIVLKDLGSIGLHQMEQDDCGQEPSPSPSAFPCSPPRGVVRMTSGATHEAIEVLK
jgi:hypothetical protein